MSLLDWFAQASQVEDITSAGESWWWTGAARQLASKVKVDNQSALNYSAVWAATRAIAETMASLPAVVYEQVSDAARVRAKGTRLYRILHDEPNPDMDAMTFYELQTARLVNQGNAFAEIQRSRGGEAMALWPIHNSRVKVWRTGATNRGGRFGRGELEYHVAADDGGYYVIPARDMLNVVGTHSHDGILASGVIPRAAESIGLGIATERYGASFFGSGARPPGVLQHPGHINDPQIRANIRREWNEVHSGDGNWQNIAVLWEGMQFKDIGVSPDQAQFIATRRFNTTVLAQWYGVSPAILQDFADSKFATVEAQLKHFIMLSVRPWAVRWERAINRQVIGLDSPYFVEFVMNALLRGDPKTQAETNQIKFMHGALSDDEWRAQDNDNPLPDGKGSHYYVPVNLARVEDVVSGRAQRGTENGSTENGSDATETAMHSLRQVHDEQIQGERERTEAAIAQCESLRETALLKFQHMLTKDAARMIHHEMVAVRRIARTQAERFVTRMDHYYEQFEPKLCEAIQPAIEGCVAVHGAAQSVEAMISLVARRHVDESRRRLLEAAECQAHELADRVMACTSPWKDRVFDLGELAEAGQ